MPENDWSRGMLRVRLMEGRSLRPVAGATVEITYEGDPEGETIRLTTDESGMTEAIDLPTPEPAYSLSDLEQQPYALYTVRAEASGYEDVEVAGTEVLPGVTAIQEISMGAGDSADYERIVIGPHVLFGNYPPKIAEPEVLPMTETGEIVLSRVVVPEYIVVHDGAPTDSSAGDYWVRYRDYIKNVASSEIYATWEDAAIRANVLAIMSFTLNRVYTEYYRGRGYDFTLTSSTAFDQKWVYGRNIFDTISNVVDEMFGNYLSRPNVKQPLLTQYCDGRNVSCPNWLSQWGSQSLAQQGYSTIEILRHYYGESIYINTAEEISGVPASWPGYDLSEGSSGQKVLQLQEELRVIAEAYPALPRITADGVYGPATRAAVEKFQSIFGLPVTGSVDYRTWYKISEYYVGVSRIAEGI